MYNNNASYILILHSVVLEQYNYLFLYFKLVSLQTRRKYPVPHSSSLRWHLLSNNFFPLPIIWNNFSHLVQVSAYTLPSNRVVFLHHLRQGTMYYVTDSRSHVTDYCIHFISIFSHTSPFTNFNTNWHIFFLLLSGHILNPLCLWLPKCDQLHFVLYSEHPLHFVDFYFTTCDIFFG